MWIQRWPNLEVKKIMYSLIPFTKTLFSRKQIKKKMSHVHAFSSSKKSTSNSTKANSHNKEIVLVETPLMQELDVRS